MATPPNFVGREGAVSTFRAALEAANDGSGALLMVHGPAGIGKTRFLEVASDEAREAGFLAASGLGLVESFVLYHPWSEALGQLGLEHLLRDEPPPRLLALYLVSSAGLPVVRAERAGFSEDPALLAMMLNNAGEFLRDAIRVDANSVEGDVMRLAVGGRGVCIVRGQDAALLAVFEGRETELFVRDVRRTMDDVTRQSAGRLEDWDGNRGAVKDLGALPAGLLHSGKYDGVDLAADGQARKLNLFDNVLFGLRRKATAQPVLVVLDDLQWADPSSLGLLHYLARNMRDARVVFLGAYRAEERETRPHLRQALAAMEREELPRDIRLDALTPAEARGLTEAILGPCKLSEEFFALIARETEGSPMIIREVLRQFQEEGALAGDPVDGLVRATRPLERLKVPTRIRDAVANRLAGLERTDRELLDAAAVCGTRFDGGLVASLVGEKELAVQRRLSSIARGLGLVRPEGTSWRFDHPVVREVVYDTMPQGLRKLYHREAGEFLSASKGADADVGEHFAAAGDARGINPLRAAGERALAQGAPYEAARMFETAAAIAEPQDAVDLVAKRAGALELAGHYEEALATIDQAKANGLDPFRAADLRATVLERMSRFEEVIRVVDEALPTTEGANAGRLLTLRARALNGLARYAEAAEAGSRALDLLPLGEARKQAEAFREVGKTQLYLGRYDEALENFSRGLRQWEVAGDRRGVGLALLGIGSTYGNRGDTQQAIGALRRALADFEAVGDRSGVAACGPNLAEGLADIGELDEALEKATRSHSVAESIGAVGLTAFAESMVGYVHVRRGEAQTAIEWLDRCVAKQRALGAKRGLANVLAESVRPRLQLGDAQGAAANAEEALRLARETHDAPNEAIALRARAEVAGALGDTDLMRNLFTQAQDGFQRLKQTKELAENHARWAQAAQRASLPDEARGHWSQAAELFEKAKLSKLAAAARASGGGLSTDLAPKAEGGRGGD